MKTVEVIANYVSPHWTDEDYSAIECTGITNFQGDKLGTYIKAIQEYTGRCELFISTSPIAYTYGVLDHHYSLHVKNINETLDLSSFWRIFEKIAEENK